MSLGQVAHSQAQAQVIIVWARLEWLGMLCALSVLTLPRIDLYISVLHYLCEVGLALSASFTHVMLCVAAAS